MCSIFITFVVGKLLGTPQGGKWLQERYIHSKWGCSRVATPSSSASNKLWMQKAIEFGRIMESNHFFHVLLARRPTNRRMRLKNGVPTKRRFYVIAEGALPLNGGWRGCLWGLCYQPPSLRFCFFLLFVTNGTFVNRRIRYIVGGSVKFVAVGRTQDYK